jgi:hypothetical protein
MKEDNWQIRVSLQQIIEVANNLNIKYSIKDKTLPNFDLSLMDEIDQSFNTDKKIEDLEFYLNQLLQADQLLFC